MLRIITALSAAMLLTQAALAISFSVVPVEGDEQAIDYKNSTLRNKGVRLDSGELLGYPDISQIRTDDFTAYEKAVSKISKKGFEQVGVVYTGSENVDALRLEALERKRKGSGAARGAGGLLMLIGVLGGDRSVYAAGLATYGAGTIAKDINTDKTIKAQNEAIKNLQHQQQALSEAEDLEAQFRIEYGNEAADGVLALADNDHSRAIALANAGVMSKDGNHRLAAAWLKALIYADQNDHDVLQAQYERLIILDPETTSVANAEEYMVELQAGLKILRNDCAAVKGCANL